MLENKLICVFTLASDFSIYYKIINPLNGEVSEEIHYGIIAEMNEQYKEFEVDDEILKFKGVVALEYGDVQFVGIHEEY